MIRVCNCVRCWTYIGKRSFDGFKCRNLRNWKRLRFIFNQFKLVVVKSWSVLRLKFYLIQVPNSIRFVRLTPFWPVFAIQSWIINFILIRTWKVMLFLVFCNFNSFCFSRRLILETIDVLSLGQNINFQIIGTWRWSYFTFLEQFIKESSIIRTFRDAILYCLFFWLSRNGHRISFDSSTV